MLNVLLDVCALAYQFFVKIKLTVSLRREKTIPYVAISYKNPWQLCMITVLKVVLPQVTVYAWLCSARKSF